MAGFWGVVVLGAIPAFAGEGGGQAGTFLSYGVGARALAMGGAFYAISDDATAGYWNPAGLAQVQRKELTTMQATLFAQTKLTYMGFAYPRAAGGTWAFSLTQLVSSGFEKVSATFDPATSEPTGVQTAGSFSDQQTAYGLSWGKQVTDTMSFGTTLKQVKRQLDNSVDSHMAMDIGMMRQMSSLHRLGIGVQNVFSRSSGDTDDKLPVTAKLGNSLTLFKGRLLFGLDLAKPQTSGLGWRFGGEFWATRWFPLRFGLMGSPGIQETDFGFGLAFRYFNLDIANGIHDLGASTRISLTAKFGKSKNEVSGEKISALIQAGFEAFKEGNFRLATVRFTQAADADPENRDVRAMLTRLQTAVTYVPEAQGGEEIQTYIRKGVIAYVDGRDLRGAVNSLRYAFNKNPRDEKLLSLLNLVERETGASEMTRKPEGPEQFTFVDQKIFDARQAVYDGKYDLAIRRTQDVLDLEPNNVTALEIMGSAFFLMEERAKAKAVWKKVLQIDPKNRVVREFLQQIQ